MNHVLSLPLSPVLNRACLPLVPSRPGAVRRARVRPPRHAHGLRGALASRGRLVCDARRGDAGADGGGARRVVVVRPKADGVGVIAGRKRGKELGRRGLPWGLPSMISRYIH